MSRLFPKPRPAFKTQYEEYCSRGNLKLVMFFSLLAIVVFTFHLLHHFRLGMAAFNPEMLPYTIIYGFGIAYPALNILLLKTLKDNSALAPVKTLIQTLFPFFMASIAVVLAILSAQFGLGVTPFAIIMMVVCFTLQGQFSLLCVVVALAFWLLSLVLIMTTPAHVYSPLVAISFTTAIACIVIANITEKLRITNFEIVTELNSNNRQLRRLSQQDHLTKLLNRRAIDQVLEKELARSERFDHSLSLLMIDVDNFKHLNDSYGHVFGDQVLIDVSSSITRHIRDVDYAGRLGGDEFVVILVESDSPSAQQVADRIRTEVNKLDSKYSNCTVSVSIGHAASEGESHVALIEKADKALYMAKKAGKNKVRSISSGFQKPSENPSE